VNNITSPSGDADADGILVFSSNRLASPTERQIINGLISGNRITQVKGRFIKLQSSNICVSDNYMSNVGNEVITNFQCVDAQVGGVRVHNNFIRMGHTSGGSSATLVSFQAKATGDFENLYAFNNNQVILETLVPYVATLYVTSGANGSFHLLDNCIHSKDNNTTATMGTGVQLDIEDTTFSYAEVKIEGNTLPTYAGRLFKFFDYTDIGDATNGPIMAAKFYLSIRNNINSIPNANADVITSGDGVPYLQNFVIAGNTGFTRASLTAKGVDVQNLQDGNAFYYNTDGGAGGLINAPNGGYNRNVLVECFGKNFVRLTYITGTKSAVFRKDTLVGNAFTPSSVLTF